MFEEKMTKEIAIAMATLTKNERLNAALDYLISAFKKETCADHDVHKWVDGTQAKDVMNSALSRFGNEAVITAVHVVQLTLETLPLTRLCAIDAIIVLTMHDNGHFETKTTICTQI